MRGYKPFASAGALKSQIRAMLGVYDRNMLDGIKDEDKKVLISTADQTLGHEFDLLGSGPVFLNPIDWHTDFKTGARWGKKYYLEIKGIKGSDIKYPWELSRCQHLLWLGEAYLLTQDSKYAKEVVEEINWWIDDNQLMYTVNWRCAMDVAFRAINWIHALNMVSDYPGFDDAFCAKVTRSLWEHGFFIWNNLEKLIPYSNNHYFSDIVGLLYIGALFRSTRKGQKWGKYALQEYYKEIRTQTLSSGVNYEKSISYHRLMTEMASYPVYMLFRCGEHVPDDVIELVNKSHSFIANYTKPNGFAPLVGDNDDGRFLPFIKRDFRCHGYLNDVNSIENRITAIGLKKIFVSQSLQKDLYDDAGFAIIRRGDAFLFVSNGEYSKYPGETTSSLPTHTHNDSLSFELLIGGNDIIIDPGTYLYTASPKDRNNFRSTIKHNTIIVDKEEQNNLSDKTMFVLGRNNHKDPLKIIDGKLVGSYQTVQGSMHHKRCFDLNEGRLIITDSLRKKGNGHTATRSLHFAEGINPVLKDNDIIIDTPGFEILIGFDDVGVSEIIDDTTSPSYGVLKSSKTLVNAFSFDEQINLITTIKWTKRRSTR